ncbi:MAG: spondin domain-containing protein [Myxococcota bacterium]
MTYVWRNRWLIAGALSGMVMVGCGDDDGTMSDVDMSTTDMGGATPDMSDDDDMGSGMDDDMGSAGPTRFVLRIENTSGSGPIPGPISPGVVLATEMAAPLFTVDAADRGEGLVAIAEDGNAGELAGNVEGSVAFSMPDGGGEAGPAFPGSFYEATIEAEAGDALHFATMFVQSNDVFLSPDEAGIPLFDAEGNPLPERDVTDLVSLWDVGSEANEAPGSGPNQAPRQGGMDVGAAEGVVRPHTAPTHALPTPSAFVGVEVTETGGTYTFEVTNTAPTSGTLLTPFADITYALHGDAVQFFTLDAPASAGLEVLAEDGGGAAWAAELDAVDGVMGAVASAGGPVMGGDSLSFSVTPTAAAPLLSFGAMVVQTNDAFWSTPPAGIPLLDDADMPRAAADVQADVMALLRIYDAGTEVDEVPGVGPNQAPRQGTPDTGEDEGGVVRLYDRTTGTTNALADLATSGLLSVTVEEVEGALVVSVQSNGEGFPGLTPVAWALHTDAIDFFTAGAPASAGLQALAEDGAVGDATSGIVGELMGADAVDQAGVEAIPNTAEGPGPAQPGDGYTFSVVPSMEGRFLSIATMVIPSNDLFLAFGPSGVALLEEDGSPRSVEDINADIAGALAVWDAGTEQNQAGAAGSMQARPPFFGGPGGQGGPNMGEAEGNGLVRQVPDGVWAYPGIDGIVRVTIAPAE